MMNSLRRSLGLSVLVTVFGLSTLPAAQAGDSWEKELHDRLEQDAWREQIAADREAWDQQRQQDDEWREQMKAWHQEMADAGMPQPAGRQQAGGNAILPNPQVAKLVMQQVAAAQAFVRQAQAMQQAVFQGFGAAPPAPKAAIPAAPPVVKANPPQPVPPVPLADGERARGKFDLAMLLAEAGKSDTAREYCQFIVKTYPGTQGAAQAQAYLNRSITP
jgi:hypothetical protein